MSNQITSPGRIKEITAVSNPLIKEIKGLDRKKNRDAMNVFLAEGLQLITFAVETGWKLKTLIYAKTAFTNEHLQSVATKARAHGTDILEVSQKVLSAITKRDNPQTVIGIIEQRKVSHSSITPNDGATWVALDRVRDPGNLGTILRTCDAAGAKGVILVGDTTDPFSLEAVRASMGSLFNIGIAKMDTTEFANWTSFWKAKGGKIVGTHLEGAADYRKMEFRKNATLLLMGNEQQGLPQELVSICDDLALIPMAGRAESLNLAIATSLMLFEIERHNLTVETHHNRISTTGLGNIE